MTALDARRAWDMADFIDRIAASAGTRPKGGDGTKIAAPFTSGAVPKADARTQIPPSNGPEN